jgi:hypothetical protein
MCNLYSITTNQAAIIALFRVMNRYVGNLPPMPGVFPDYPAPVVRNANAERELTMMRWGMPPPPKFGRRKKIRLRQHEPQYGRAVRLISLSQRDGRLRRLGDGVTPDSNFRAPGLKRCDSSSNCRSVIPSGKCPPRCLFVIRHRPSQ